jgi:histone-lysine N-methyltransferase SETMAR
MHKELVLKGQTVNSEFYRTVIDRLMKRVQCSKLDKAQFGNRFLLHDNAPSHNTVIINQSLSKKNITAVDHHPHSPQLTPADYFQFPKLKYNLNTFSLAPFSKF